MLYVFPVVILVVRCCISWYSLHNQQICVSKVMTSPVSMQCILGRAMCVCECLCVHERKEAYACTSVLQNRRLYRLNIYNFSLKCAFASKLRTWKSCCFYFFFRKSWCLLLWPKIQKGTTKVLSVITVMHWPFLFLPSIVSDCGFEVFRLTISHTLVVGSWPATNVISHFGIKYHCIVLKVARRLPFWIDGRNGLVGK